MTTIKTRYFLFFCLFFLLSYSSGIQAQDGAANSDVVAILKDFYTKYMIMWEINAPNEKQQEKAFLAKHVDAALLKKIDKQTKAGDLDYDPFLKAQDVDTACLRTLTVTKNPAQAGQYDVAYQVEDGKKLIHLIVVRENDSYMIKKVW